MERDINIYIENNDELEVRVRPGDQCIIINYDEEVVIYIPINKVQELLKKLKDVLP